MKKYTYFISLTNSEASNIGNKYNLKCAEDILENVKVAFEVIEDLLLKSHSIGYFSTRSRQLEFRDAIINIINDLSKKTD